MKDKMIDKMKDNIEVKMKNKMKDKMKDKIPWIGIITCILYFLSVGLFLITKTEMALTVWEMLTVLGAPMMLIVLVDLSERMQINGFYRNLMLVFMACTCSLTGLAHIVNITVTRRLMTDGVAVPEYFQIGYWPSVEMAVDYLAWGFFMGLAFIAFGLAVKSKERIHSQLKMISLVNGSLCLLGFFGSITINESLWYVAPVGYGFGTIVLCVRMLKLHR